MAKFSSAITLLCCLAVSCTGQSLSQSGPNNAYGQPYNPHWNTNTNGNGNSYQAWCPHPNSIYPCECGGPQNFPLFTCNNVVDNRGFERASRARFPVTDYGKLSITKTYITRMPSPCFPYVRFEYIHIKKNPLRSIDKTCLDNSKLSLKRLEIVHNELEKFPFRPQANFTKLETVDLFYNSIEEIPDYAFGFSPKLKRIDLSFNKINYVGSYAFNDLPALEYLNLKYNKLTTLNNYAFSARRPNPTLELDLSNNAIILITEGAFQSQVPKVLDLSQNGLKKLPESIFSPILTAMMSRTYGVVNVSGNRFRCTCQSIGWLTKKDEVFRSRVIGLYCVDLNRRLEDLTPRELQC